MDWKAVGRRIRELRGFDVTQADLAHRIGVSQGYLSTVEHGQGEIGAEVLLAISHEFNELRLCRPPRRIVKHTFRTEVPHFS